MTKNQKPLTDGKVCVMLSGGLDSCVLVATLAERFDEVYPLYVRKDLVWEAAELYWARQFITMLNPRNIHPVKEIELPVKDVYNSHWSTTGDHTPDHRSDDHEVYLPGRNLLLLAKASIFCALNEIPAIALGPLKGNPFPDSTPEFFDKFREMASLALNYQLMIMTPFSQLSKHEVIKLGQHFPLHLSFSCISPAGMDHCGACNKCAERRRSFNLAGIEDKTRYHTLPPLD